MTRWAATAGGATTRRTVAAAVGTTWRASRSATVALLVLTALTGALPAVTAWLGKLLFDELALAPDADVGRAAVLAAAVAGGLGASAVVAAAAGYCSSVAKLKVTVEVTDRLIGALGRLRGLRAFEDPRYLDRLRLAEQGAREAPGALTGLGQELIRTTVTVAGFGGAVLLVWPPMALLVLAALVPVVVSQLRLSRLRVRAAESTATAQRRHLQYRYLASDLKAAKETRLFGLGALFHGRMLSTLREATAVELDVQRRVMLTSTGLAGLSTMVSAVATVVAVVRAAHGQLSLGDVTLFTAAVAAIQSAAVSVVAQLGQAGGALRLFGHYLAVVAAPDDLPNGTAAVHPLHRGIELRDVWFRYDEDGPWVLRGVDLTIPHGSAVGLVGGNGAGKSTVVKLLCRFYDPQRGRILWDGTDIRDLDLDALRARVGATFQDYMTYDLSGAENVGVGDVARLGDLDRIHRAAALAEIHDRLAALPRGYATMLSRSFLDETAAGGTTLSGGEWQRVALARSLMRDGADLLILDEPSSGLDAEAEYHVHQTLRAHRTGRTSLLVSHRLSALRDADAIVVLRDGVVVERGRHEELLVRGGDYARLFGMQARGYVEEVPA